MNQTRALNILGFSENDDPTDDELKKSYRIKILQYHPDKNRSADAPEQFRKIQEAYSFLKSPSSLNAETEYSKSYNEILKEFLFLILEEEYAEMAVPFVTQIFEIILSRLIHFIDSKSGQLLAYLSNINRPTLTFIHGMFSKYRHVFHLPNEIIERIEEILKNSMNGEYENECIVLNPTLEDLFSEENIYKLKYEDNTYFVPLWHHDIVFDHEGRDLFVKCFPVLPENMELDEWNNLTVELEYAVSDVWNQMVNVVIGGKTLQFDGRNLCLTESPQMVRFESRGVLHNNINNVFDASVTQDIILIIRLHL